MDDSFSFWPRDSGLGNGEPAADIPELGGDLPKPNRREDSMQQQFRVVPHPWSWCQLPPQPLHCCLLRSGPVGTRAPELKR
eukprot:7778366-Pyramimonas_sp.AAC.1